MSYSANSYNYATPLSSSSKLTSPVNLQLVDGRAVHSTFAGVIDSDNIVTLTGNNTGSSTSYINYFILRSELLRPATQYFLVFELFDFSGNFSLIKLTNNDAGDSQIDTPVVLNRSSLRRGVQVFPVTTGDVSNSISIRSYVVLEAGQSVNIRYRLSLLPYAPSPATFVYTKYDSNVYPLDTKFFELSNNVLDGTYYPVVGDAGVWSAVAPTASDAFILSISYDTPVTMNAFRLISSKYCYPVTFVVWLYNGGVSPSTLVKSFFVKDNTSAIYVKHFDRPITVQTCRISIRKASVEGAAVPIYNVYNPGEVARVDTLKVSQTAISVVSGQLALKGVDVLKVLQSSVTAPKMFTVHSSDVTPVNQSASGTLGVGVQASDTIRPKLGERTSVHNSFSVSDMLKTKQLNRSYMQNNIGISSKLADIATIKESEGLHITNTIRASDALKLFTDDNGTLTNIHSVMKAPSRRIYGKVYITYTDPMLNDEITDIETNSEAYNSVHQQLVDGATAVDNLFFTLYDNNLTGEYVVSSALSQVGWTSKVISDANGNLNVAPYVILSFASRPLSNLSVIFDDSHGCLAKNFTVAVTNSNGETTTFTFVDNVSTEVLVSSSVIAEAVSVKITVTKVSKAFCPVTILDIPVISTFLYVGYQDKSELINMEVLEELTYEDDIEALGGVSANEVKVALDNSLRTFNFDNVASPVAKQLRRNRKIVPYLGAEVVPGEIEWYKLGVFWSYNWEVPYNSLIANVTGFDTIGLIDTTTFINHQTQVNKSIGQLIDYIMTDAKKIFSFLEWTVAAELYNVVIPYAWFGYGSHAAALRKVSQSYPMHIYCDREGRICAAPQKLHLDYYYDKWSDSTNVVDKVYNSLYTVIPNIINVKVVSPVLTSDTSMAADSLVFDVASINSRTLNFNNPYVSGLRIVVDKDSTVQYTYAAYSWGIEFTFTGSGYVRSIECFGNTVDISNTSVVSYRDNDSIIVNGAVTRDISSDFIQTSSLASLLIDRLNELSENDKYDVEVTYRGDIALTINDPILLVDGLATDNRYNIKRQTLTWDGSLSGTANLNT